MSRTIVERTAPNFEDRVFNLTQACFKDIDSDLTDHRVKRTRGMSQPLAITQLIFKSWQDDSGQLSFSFVQSKSEQFVHSTSVLSRADCLTIIELVWG